MSRASASADGTFRVEAYCGIFQKLAIPIPDSLIRMASAEESSAEVPSFGRTPALALLRHFAGSHSQWPRFLKGNPWTAQALAELLEMVSVQADYQFASPLTAAQSYCLTVRRWMGAIARNPDYADIEIITDVIRHEKLLPQARGFPQDESITMTPQWHDQCARYMERLYEGSPISRLKHKAGDRSTTNPDAPTFRLGKGKFAKGRPAKDLTDPFWIITRSAWQEVESASEGGKAIGRNEARALLVILLECVFGIVEEDVQCLRINETGGPISIYPDEKKVILHIGPQFHSTGRCFQRSDLTLPLPSELSWLLKSCHTTGPGRLLDLWTPDGWLATKKIIRSKAQTSGYATRPMEWSAHRIHREVAVMHLQQSVAEVCLIEGRPILGYRGPCSYLSIREDKALQLFIDTYHRTRELMGFPRRELPAVSCDPTIYHGKRVKSYRELVDRLRFDVTHAHSHNGVMACVERLMRLLGMRKSVVHVNPARFARRFPDRLLLITDKVVGEDAHPHWLWLSPELWTLVDALDLKLGANQVLLPYVQGYKLVTSAALKNAEAREVHRITHDPGLSRVARIAFRTALRELGAGDTVCDLAMGHAPVCGPLDYERPDSGRMMTHAVKHFLARLYEEYGINEIALHLAEKLSKYCGCVTPNITLKWDANRVERFSPRHGGKTALSLWSKQQDGWFVRIWNAVENPERFPANEQAQRAYLLVLVAVECGVPPTYLLRFSAYYTLHNFLHSAALERAWFLANTGDCDKGRLSSYPISLRYVDGEQSTVWRFVRQILRAARGTGDRGCRRGINWKLFDGVTADDLGRYIRKLLFGCATNAPLSNSAAFELLELCARVRSRHLHPGYVAGVLAQALPQVLNHFDAADVIRFRREVPDLCLLDGRPFQPVRETGTRMPKNATLSRKLEEIAWDASLDERGKAQKTWEHIRDLPGPIPGEGWIRKHFVACQVPGDDIPRRNSARAARIMRAVVREREKSYALKMSKSLRLPPVCERSQLHEKVSQYLHECRPKIALMATRPEDKDIFKQQVSGLAEECLALISCFGLRSSEATRLLSERNSSREHWPFVSVGRFGQSLWCIVRGTKTHNAKRVTRSFFCPWPEIVDELLESLATPRSTILHGTKARVKNAAENVGGSLHLFRHWMAIAAVDRIVDQHYLVGNALLILESFTRGLGHGCMATTYQSYLGSSMATLSLD